VSVLEVSDLTVEYGPHGRGRFRAVDGLSLTLRAGQTLALVGESGSGKSTVVRALAQLTARTSGEIRLDGQPAGRRGRALRSYRHRVQLVFQDPFASLNPMHTVRHHLARPLLLRHGRLLGGQPRSDRPRSGLPAVEWPRGGRSAGGGLRGEELDQAVAELLRSVNLTPPEEIAAKHPHELSGGQRQRVAIARALATDPDVLLADEPVSMLDVSIRLEILNLLDRLKRDRNLALLYVTHDLATARHFSSEIMVMYRGEIVERGPSDDVILRPSHPYTQILASAAPDPTLPRAVLAQARRDRQAARAARQAGAARQSARAASQAGAARQSARAVGQARSAGRGRSNGPIAGSGHPLGDDAGCRFRARCPSAMPVCAEHPPEFPAAPAVPSLDTAEHVARCWLLDSSVAVAGQDGL
jgi:peptide/nickel transport system ATP-binding protein